MKLREIKIEEIQDGDFVRSHRGRLGKILLGKSIGIEKQHPYVIIWDITGIWSDAWPISSYSTNHGLDIKEYPIIDTDVEYLGSPKVFNPREKVKQ